MAQGTNAAAYKRLQPLQNTNTGSLVEEHIRYWKKYKDEEEAEKLAMDAKRREYESKISEKYDKAVTDLTGTDVIPYFQNSVVEAKEFQAGELARLAKGKTDGDATLSMQYNAKQMEFKQLSTLATDLSAKLKESNAKIQSGTYNKVLDQPMVDLTNAINKGQFVVDKKTLKLRVYSNDGKRVLFDGSSEQLKNEYLSSGFNKPINPDQIGEEISQGIVLPDDNGNMQWTPKSERLAIIKVGSRLENDPTLMETYKRMNKIYKPTEELSPLEKNTLSAKFFEDHVRGGVKTKDNSYANANVKSSIYKRNFDIANTNRKIQEKLDAMPTIALATTAGGAPLKSPTKQAKGQAVSAKTGGAQVFTIAGEGVTITEVDGDKETNITYRNIEKDTEGKVTIKGQKVVKEPILAPNGDDTGKTKENITDIVVTDDVGLNNIAIKIKNKNGKRFKNYNELAKELSELSGEPSIPIFN
jgi:hypothetical protein